MDTDILSRQFAMLYCGEYAGEDDFIYVAANLHWTCQDFALPKLPRKYGWKVVSDTNPASELKAGDRVEEKITVKERSIVVLLGTR